MKKNLKRYNIITILIAILYTILVFVIPFDHKSTFVFWFAYITGLIAIGVQPFISYYSYKDDKSLKSVIFGWPIVRIGYIYLIIQLLLTIIFFIVGAFVEIPNWILPILVCILLTLTIIGLFVSKSYKETIQQMESVAPITTKFINDLTVDTKILVEQVNNDKTKQELTKLADEIRYSDPVSNDSLIELEDEINRKYVDLKDEVIAGNYEIVSHKVNELIILIKERNLRLKTLKNSKQ